MKTKTTQRNYEIIVFSDDWNGLPFSCKHLLRHFLPDVKLIWVETIGLRSPKLNLYDINRSIKKITGWLSKSQGSQGSLPENLYILDPFQIPYNQANIVREFNKQIIVRKINRDFPNGGDRERVLITTWPFIGNLVGALNERVSIYYRVDDNSELPKVNKGLMQRLEMELIGKVDMVIASAEKLTKISMGDKEVKYLPHGVDFEHFAKTDCDSRKEVLIQRIPGPRIGFFGQVDLWFDFDLVSHVAADHRNWSFVFLGPSHLSPSSLPKAPNIHFLGPVSYEELPVHARHFDVGLIPFKINALTKADNPLKLMEYFSLGLPVVSTPMPEVIKFQDYVMIASEVETFGSAIQTALDQDNKKLQLLRQSIAKAHSWEKKALELENWIEEILERKNCHLPSRKSF